MDTQYQQVELSLEEIKQRLNNASPLQVSKTLIDIELFDQKDSLDILDAIYKEFDSGANIIDELVQPVSLSVIDSIVSHPKLKLHKTGLSASRVLAEVKDFKYPESSQAVTQRLQLNEMRTAREYNKEVRKTMTNRKNLQKNKERHFGNNSQGYSDLEVNDDGSRQRVYRDKKSAEAKQHKHRAADTDHVIPVKQINDQYANNAFLQDPDIAAMTDNPSNLIEISNSYNRAKGAKNFSDMQAEKKGFEAKIKRGEKLTAEENKKYKNLSKYNDETLENSVKKEKESTDALQKQAKQHALDNVRKNKLEIGIKAGKQAGERTFYQSIGHALILFIKPLFFELGDAIKNGTAPDHDLISDIKRRMVRFGQYIKANIIPTLGAVAKDFCSNFFQVLLDGIVGLVTGLFKSVFRIVSEGFSAMVSAFKVLLTPGSEMTGAEKADAISKIFASSIVTFVVFYFESVILPAIPIDFLKDIILAMLSGVGSVIVIYILNKIDIFSTKFDKRSRRIKEVFDYRVDQIKKNTDMFDTEAAKTLASDKLRFRTISEQLVTSIKEEKNVNQSVYDLAEHFKIDLNIRSTDQFLNMLKNTDAVII